MRTLLSLLCSTLQSHQALAPSHFKIRAVSAVVLKAFRSAATGHPSDQRQVALLYSPAGLYSYGLYTTVVVMLLYSPASGYGYGLYSYGLYTYGPGDIVVFPGWPMQLWPI